MKTGKLDTFLLSRRDYGRPLQRICLDQATRLDLMALMNDPQYLNDDLKKWADTAKHGDMFILTSDYAVVMIELDTFWPFFGKGPAKLWNL